MYFNYFKNVWGIMKLKVFEQIETKLQLGWRSFKRDKKIF